MAGSVLRGFARCVGLALVLVARLASGQTAGTTGETPETAAAPAPERANPFLNGYRFDGVNRYYARCCASHPGRVPLSTQKLARFHEQLSAAERTRNNGQGPMPIAMVGEHLMVADSRAAVVVAVQPALVVAAYSDEFDEVVLLRFDRALATEYHLTPGSRLLTVNSYDNKAARAVDLVDGRRSTRRYTNVRSLIADFLTEDADRLASAKAEIDDAEWTRATAAATQAWAARAYLVRDGNPYRVHYPPRVRAYTGSP